MRKLIATLPKLLQIILMAHTNTNSYGSRCVDAILEKATIYRGRHGLELGVACGSTLCWVKGLGYEKANLGRATLQSRTRTPMNCTTP